MNNKWVINNTNQKRNYKTASNENNTNQKRNYKTAINYFFKG